MWVLFEFCLSFVARTFEAVKFARTMWDSTVPLRGLDQGM